MKPLYKAILVGTLATGSVGLAHGGTVVFEENFFGTGDPLNGKTPDATTNGEAWEAGDEWGDDGIHFSPTAGGQASHLDYTPQPGRVYTASARVRNPHANFFAFGFLPATPASGDWAAENFSVTHNNAPGYAWILTADRNGPDQAAYLGPGVGGAQPWNGNLFDTNTFIDFDIVLDTTGEFWTAEWLINGVPQGPAAAFPNPGNPGIGGIGFSRDQDATTDATFIEMRSFSLTYVPEPGSLALLALGGWCVATRTRRRR